MADATAKINTSRRSRLDQFTQAANLWFLKRCDTLLNIGIVCVVVLVVVDGFLLYGYLHPKKRATKAVQTKRPPEPPVPIDDGVHQLLEQLQVKDKPAEKRLCETPGCLWLQDYLEASRRSVEPCDNFYEHVCGKRSRSLLLDSQRRLESAVATSLLETIENEPQPNASLFLERCLHRETVSEMTRHKRMSPVVRKNERRAFSDSCSRPSRTRWSPGRSLENLDKCQASQLHQCLRLLEDVFPRETVLVVTSVLGDAVKDLETALRRLALWARQALALRVGRWMSGVSAAEGQLNESAARESLRRLKEVGVAAMASSSERELPDESIFSWQEQLQVKDKPAEKRLCETPGCLWLQDYLEASRRSVEPCDNFYEHVCGKRSRSLLLDSQRRLESAVATSLLETIENEPQPNASLFLERCLHRETVSEMTRHKRMSPVVRKNERRAISDSCNRPSRTCWSPPRSLENLDKCQASQLHQCLRLLEDIFPRETVQVVTSVLGDAVKDLQTALRRQALWARQALALRVGRWMSGVSVAEGQLNDTAARESLRRLKEVGVAAMASSSEREQLDQSIFSWQVSFDKRAKTLVIPYGLFAPLTKRVPFTIEGLFVPILSAGILRVLLPRPDGIYSWMSSHQARLDTAADCFGSQLSLYSQVATEVAFESALLSPLFDLYRRKLHEDRMEGLRLHKGYDNAQVFFVLWALGHCGTPNGAQVVNGAAKNYVRFERTFCCSCLSSMFVSKRCSFWV
ncbi:hypothetical protein ISCGN_019310 [Ixodes scapularis]